MKKISKKTDRLILRPLELSDFDIWQQANHKKRVQQNKWDDRKHPKKEMTKAKFRALLAREKMQREMDSFYTLNIFEKKTNSIVGLVSAMNVNRGLAQSAYLGYFINNNHWRKGFGSEAVLAMIHFCFKNLNLHRVEAGIEPSNKRSIYLVRSLGLRKEGLKKRMVLLRGKWVDLTIYSMTSDELGYVWKQPSSGKLSL